MENIIDLMTEISKRDEVSDLHLSIMKEPVIRVNGQLETWDDEKLTAKDLKVIRDELLNKDQKKLLEEQGELDFSYGIKGVCRFRVNAYYQRGSIAFALRSIPFNIMGIDELGLPPLIKEIALLDRGLVLVTGPTGSGKSTTLAAILDYINKTSRCHILTLEDPIEYLHHHEKSLVHQREVGSDTQNFADALRVTLRQDPDVILVGEMRDLETISLALEAAETGHLVLATLHTNDAPQTVDRVIDVFPSSQHQQIRVQLSAVIEAIISQRLLPRAMGDGRVAAFEILVGNSAVRNLIREGKSFQLHSTMQLGQKSGMKTMDQDLARLLGEGKISKEEAMKWCQDKKQLERHLRTGSMGSNIKKKKRR